MICADVRARRSPQRYAFRIRRMEKFTETDLDRPWPSRQLSALSERELTKLAFLRDCKNLAFFLPAGYVFYLAGSFGTIGKIIAWVGILVFGAFAIYGLFKTAFGLVVLVGTPFMEKDARLNKSFWRSLQFVIAAASFAIYTTLAFAVYSGIYGVSLSDYLSL